MAKTIVEHVEKLKKQLTETDWTEFSDYNKTQVYIVLSVGVPGESNGKSGIATDVCIGGASSLPFIEEIIKKQILAIDDLPQNGEHIRD